MRLAFIVMALLNLAFFAWQYPKDEDWQLSVVQNKPRVKEGKETIILLHEMKSSMVPISEEPSADAIQPVSLTRPVEAAPAQSKSKSPSVRQQRLQEILAERKCYSVGPFFNRDAGDRIATRLEGLGAYTRIRTAENQENLRYWVTYVAQNEYTAKQTFNDLQGKGLRDISLMSGEGGNNVVSLGLFRGESTANRRMDEVRNLGYDPTVKKQFSSRTAFWVEAEEDPKQALSSAVWRQILEFSDEALQRPITCR